MRKDIQSYKKNNNIFGLRSEKSPEGIVCGTAHLLCSAVAPCS